MRDNITTLITVFLVFGIMVSGLVYYKTVQIKAMQSNIESAIVKGIDPIAVRCAYAGDDAVCVAYALRKSPEAPVANPVKK